MSNSSDDLKVGTIAGIAVGIALAAPLDAGIAVLLSFAAVVAIYVASLGWGIFAGALASILALAVVHIRFILSPEGGISLLQTIPMAAILLFPAAWIGHSANATIGIDEKENPVRLALPNLLFRLAAAVAAGYVAAGIAIGYEAERFTQIIASQWTELLETDPQTFSSLTFALGGNFEPDSPASIESIEALARLTAELMPLIASAIGFAMHVVALLVAGALLRKMQREIRKKDDIAAELNLPVKALAMPALGFAGMAIGIGGIAEIGAVLVGVGVLAFALVGIAQLHFLTRNVPGRAILIALGWLSIPFFGGFPILFFAALGAARATLGNLKPSPPT